MLKWQEVLEEAQYKELTSSYIAREKYISLQHASVVLRRLWTWGLLRRKRDKDIDSPGQPRYSYEITNRGENYLSWYREQPEQKRRTKEEVLREDIDAILTKHGIPKIEKTEKEKALEEIYIILDEVEKRTRKSAQKGLDWVLDELFWREFVYYLKDKGMLKDIKL
jgi:DNA-binding transcriptional regulator GbsR (MarR family)